MSHPTQTPSFPSDRPDFRLLPYLFLVFLTIILHISSIFDYYLTYFLLLNCFLNLLAKKGIVLIACSWCYLYLLFTDTQFHWLHLFPCQIPRYCPWCLPKPSLWYWNPFQNFLFCQSQLHRQGHQHGPSFSSWLFLQIPRVKDSQYIKFPLRELLVN